MSEKKQPLKRELVNGELKIEGEEHPLFQGIIRAFRVFVSDLNYADGYALYSGDATHNERIAGKAEIDRKDELRIAGWKEKTRTLDFGISPLDDEKAAWQVSVGYLPYDWEVGNAPAWFIEIYAPRAAFERLLSEYHQGRVNWIMVNADIDLWARTFDKHTPPSASVMLFLLPDEKYGNQVDMARGKVSSISWSKTRPGWDDEEPAPDTPAQETSVPAAPAVLQPQSIVINPDKTIRFWLGLIAVLLAVIAFRV